jgi:hypothetical protein
VYLVSTAIILVSIYRARSGKAPRVRDIAGIGAVEEAMGRAAEMGKPVHYTFGIGGLIKAEGPQTLAALSILTHVSSLAAKYDVRLIVTLSQPEVLPIATDVVKQAFLTEGKSELFRDDTVRYLSSNQFAYAAAVMGILQREKAAANIMMGYYGGESLLLAEAGHEVGGIQIAGTANISQVPYFVASCDYTLIGEELFVAAAVLSDDAIQLGSVRGQDLAKALIWVLAVVGVVSAQLGSKWVTTLMSK